MAAKTSGLRNSHAASSDFVTVTKSDPKKTRVTPAQQEQAQRNQIETLKKEREREREGRKEKSRDRRLRRAIWRGESSLQNEGLGSRSFQLP